MKKLLFALACLALAGAFWAFRGEFTGVWSGFGSFGGANSVNALGVANAKNSANSADTLGAANSVNSAGISASANALGVANAKNSANSATAENVLGGANFANVFSAANSANSASTENAKNSVNFAKNSTNFAKNSRPTNSAAGKKRVIIKELTPLKCNLNETPCEYEFQGRRVRVEFKDKPILAMVENELVIENLGDFGALDMRIYGLNMYMGDITPRLKALPRGTYKANVVLSSCVVKVMRFRAEFFKGEKQLDFHFDFDVKR